MALGIDAEDTSNTWAPDPKGATEQKNTEEKVSGPNLLHLDALLSLLRTTESRTRIQRANDTTTTPDPPSYLDTLPSGFHLRHEVRTCDWKSFKNELETDTPCVVDILVANSDLPLQVLDDEAQRKDGYDAERLRETEEPRHNMGGIIGEEPWIHRIRIRSAAVLQALGLAAGVSWDITKTHLFMRPLQFLILHQERVRGYLEALESEANDTLAKENDTDQGLLTAGEVLQQIRCYVEFVDKALMSVCQQYNTAVNGQTKVRFDDLWYLFRPGELVYLDPKNAPRDLARGKEALSEKSKQRIARVISTSPPLPRVAGEGLFRSGWRCGPKIEGDAIGDGKDEDRDSFEVELYFLDFDGDNFIPWYMLIPIRPYFGSMRIECLRLYPLRFADAAERIRGYHIAQGEKFLECINSKHMRLSGAPLIYEPDGSELLSLGGEPLPGFPRYAGEVYIDVGAALRFHSFWSTWNHRYTRRDPIFEEIVERYPVIKQSNEAKPLESKAYREVLLWNQDAFSRIQANRQFLSDEYLRRENGVPLASFPLQREDLALLPCRVYACLLRIRVFVSVSIYDLQPIVPEPQALDEIYIDKDLKHTLKAVVHEHFELSELRAQDKALTYDKNSHGNDQGLVILLQGPPGTGKIATAEAIAQEYHRPLMVIDKADLVGFGEGSLELLQYAASWNCVVLLDEVDAFLQRRSERDVHSNSDASLLLRILETFSGLLILTTCRPAVLDQRVKSRVHLNLCLKPLNLDQTLKIFKHSIKHLQEVEKKTATPEHRSLGILEGEILEFAETHFRENTIDHGRWNGRQIRNAVRVAAAIARYQVLNTELEPQLRPEHFRKVAELTKQYDHVRYQALSEGDSYLAWERGGAL